MKDDYAFPRVTKLGEQAPGMELRDWFAGMALQGLIASSAHPNSTDIPDATKAATWSYEYADALLKKRNRQA